MRLALVFIVIFLSNSSFAQLRFIDVKDFGTAGRVQVTRRVTRGTNGTIQNTRIRVTLTNKDTLGVSVDLIDAETKLLIVALKTITTDDYSTKETWKEIWYEDQKLYAQGVLLDNSKEMVCIFSLPYGRRLYPVNRQELTRIIDMLQKALDTKN